MKLNRIFIENLPETVTEAEIKSKFAEYGNVTSIEIKERKVVTIKNTSCFFAYVNLKTDDSGLLKCFQTFNKTSWCGEFVKLQIAKESFLERLKRERESNSQTIESIHIPGQVPTEKNTQVIPTISYDRPISADCKESDKDASLKIAPNERHKRKKKLSTSSSDSSGEEECIVKTNSINSVKSEETIEAKDDEDEILIKKPNRGARFVNGLLKIEDFGKGSIVDNEARKNEKILDKRQEEAEARRKNALIEKIKAYRQQKNAFNQFQKKPKIIRFNDDDQNEEIHVQGEYKNKSSNKMTLFEDSDSESDDLNIAKNIENRIKSDKRFELDERFLEDEKDEISNSQEDIDLKEEKQKESQILGEIFGQKFKYKINEEQTGNKNDTKYVKYDPSNPDNPKFDLKEEPGIEKNKRKKIRTNEKMVEEKKAPEVTKERLTIVKVDLKAALEKKSGFSLSEIIGDAKEKENNSVEQEGEYLPVPFSFSKPNKYDSSDDEDDQVYQPPPTQRPKKVWTEPLFFGDNDFRYQEGLDFIKRIATQERAEGEIADTRRQFKEIVRNKIRKAKKKNRPFQRKLGGSKKKKLKRMEKALKR